MSHVPIAAVDDARRYVLLDGLRGVAALAVVIHHFTASSSHRELFASAALAVEFFFCVGGFVVAAAHHDRLLAGMPLRQYAQRRLFRIYPMYASGLVCGLLAIALLKARGFTDLPWSGIAKATALNGLVLPYLNDSYVTVLETRIVGSPFPLNNPGWSLFFLLLANGLYAATVRWWRGAPFLWLGISAIGLCAATAIYGEAPGWATANFLGGFPRVLFSFFAGVGIYQLRRLEPGVRVPPMVLVAAIVALFAVPRFAGHHQYWLLAATVAIPTIVALASRSVIDREGALHRACLYAGRLSYPLYCTHYPLLMLVPLVVPRETPITFVLGGFIIATLVVATLFMRFVEQPLRAWLQRGRPQRAEWPPPAPP